MYPLSLPLGVGMPLLQDTHIKIGFLLLLLATIVIVVINPLLRVGRAHIHIMLQEMRLRMMDLEIIRQMDQPHGLNREIHILRLMGRVRLPLIHGCSNSFIFWIIRGITICIISHMDLIIPIPIMANMCRDIIAALIRGKIMSGL